MNQKIQWSLIQDRKKKMSAVVRPDGTVVCGSLICQQSNPAIFDEHELIVLAANSYDHHSKMVGLVQKHHKAIGRLERIRTTSVWSKIAEAEEVAMELELNIDSHILYINHLKES